MRRDWGSRDADFIALTARVRRRILALAGAEASHACVPLQGSGTFAVEAMLGTMLAPQDKVLILANGAYGQRMARICGVIGRGHSLLTGPEDRPVDPADVSAALDGDAAVTHVALVHCETTSGVLNPLSEIATLVADHGRRLLVDAMSSFGALPVDAAEIGFTALAASANKCLEGVPGVGFVLAETAALSAAAGNAPSLSLDLHDQWRALEANGQWRFTPPTHVLAALDAALEAHAAEGGVDGRGRRYRANCAALVAGMRALGFETLLDDAHQAPIIVTFKEPAPPYDFEVFYGALRSRGYAIYPGKLTDAPSFRIGCIGQVFEADIEGLLEAVAEAKSRIGL
jgi:2-aminoethylphosphonate-pyruvate transaminase